MADPHGMSKTADKADKDVRRTCPEAAGGVGYRATGLRPGLRMSAKGVVTGRAAEPGTYTVTVDARGRAGRKGTTTFPWTVA